MAEAPAPKVPPQVLALLKAGNKVEALKLLRETAPPGLTQAFIAALENKAKREKGASKPASPAATRIAHARRAPPVARDPRRPGLSPGEVPPGDASGFGWLILLTLGSLAIAWGLWGP